MWLVVRVCFFTYIFTDDYTYVTYKLIFISGKKKGGGNNIVEHNVFIYIKATNDIWKHHWITSEVFNHGGSNIQTSISIPDIDLACTLCIDIYIYIYIRH